MTKIRFQNARGLTLVGNFHKVSLEKVVIMCHGFTGDKSEWGWFDQVAQSLYETGFSVLAFDFSGCGESDDDSLAVHKQVSDLASAIEWVQSQGFTAIGVLGHSLGGLVALRAHHPAIKSLVLTAPVTDKKEDYATKFTDEQREELASTGIITKTRDKGVRRTFIIDKQMIIDRSTLDQDELLQDMRLPALIVHGDEDDVVPLAWSQSAIQKMPSGSDLHVIHGAGHDFAGHLDAVIAHTKAWFLQTL